MVTDPNGKDVMIVALNWVSIPVLKAWPSTVVTCRRKFTREYWCIRVSRIVTPSPRSRDLKKNEPGAKGLTVAAQCLVSCSAYFVATSIPFGRIRDLAGQRGILDSSVKTAEPRVGLNAEMAGIALNVTAGSQR